MIYICFKKNLKSFGLLQTFITTQKALGNSSIEIKLDVFNSPSKIKKRWRHRNLKETRSKFIQQSV